MKIFKNFLIGMFILAFVGFGLVGTYGKGTVTADAIVIKNGKKVSLGETFYFLKKYYDEIAVYKITDKFSSYIQVELYDLRFYNVEYEFIYTLSDRAWWENFFEFEEDGGKAIKNAIKEQIRDEFHEVSSPKNVIKEQIRDEFRKVSSPLFEKITTIDERERVFSIMSKKVQKSIERKLEGKGLFKGKLIIRNFKITKGSLENDFYTLCR